MEFKVASVGYFYVCNADKHASGFYGQMNFEETIVPYRLNITWIPSKINEMISVLNGNKPPESNPACENCAYSRERALMESE